MLNGALSDRLCQDHDHDTQRDGHVENLFDNSELNGLDDQSLRLQLRWQGDATDINLTADRDERGAPSTVVKPSRILRLRRFMTWRSMPRRSRISSFWALR